MSLEICIKNEPTSPIGPQDMDGGCYMPNNPSHWGDAGGSLAPAPVGVGASPPRCPDMYPQCWPSEDMAAFSLSSLDLDPFFSCTPSGNCKPEYPMMKERSGLTEMPDVLLTLKHPLVHPGQMSPSNFSCGGSSQCQGPSASLSYTVHPQMIPMSPGGGYSSQYCSNMDQAAIFGTNPNQHSVNMFPSMSVNVSMNIPMPSYPTGGDPLHNQMACSQVPWNNSGANNSPVYCQSGSPQPFTIGSGPTYSFTADFRPQNIPSMPSLNDCKPQRRPSCQHSNSGKLSPSSDDESSQTNLCRICGKTYARPSTLKTHLRTHSGEKPYRCDECNKSFSQAANLTAHVRTHSGEKPFRCPICDRRFSQSSSVTTHMRTHSGERPYRCRLCKKAFSDSSTLTKHLRIHSGEKPYQCKLCLLRFSQSGNLNRHMRVHGTTVPI